MTGREAAAETEREKQDTSLPLSAAQSGIWFAQQLDPSDPSYNVAEYIEVHGPLDPALFDAAIQRMSKDVEVWRLRFFQDDRGVRQVFESSTELPLLFFDVSDEESPRAAAEAWMRADAGRPFDLSGGCLSTQALFRLAPDHFCWYQCGHHLAMDGYGAALVAQRVAEIYTALAQGRKPKECSLGSVRKLWEDERAYRGSEEFARDADFWSRRFADRPLPVGLAGRPPAISRSGSVVRRTAYLSRKELDALRMAARRFRTSWAGLVIAATAGYLYRVTGVDDVILGLPVTARIGPESKRVPGTVANVMPLRLAVRPDMSLRELAAQVWARFAKCYGTSDTATRTCSGTCSSTAPTTRSSER